VTRTPYPLDNDHALAVAHHDALADLLDPVTTARLRELRRDWSGAACLEVGAGGGSIARYLADQVGPDGTVIALDLKPQHITPHPRLTVLQHDLTSDDPLPAGPWDLIHARLVLSHLPQRAEILGRLAERLAPGGVLLTEDWEALVARVVVAAPDAEAAELYQRYQATVGPKVFAAAGTDRGWARRANLAMRRLGLANVETTVNASFWDGGSVGCRLVEATTHEVETALLAVGFPSADLDEVRRLLRDPRLVVHGHPLYSTSGWRPVHQEAPDPTWSTVHEG
jgi:2-polyprenyl-3-methyl-5-hydroxy-6-metoxy-1,4-benzoquinol methylase